MDQIDVSMFQDMAWDNDWLSFGYGVFCPALPADGLQMKGGNECQTDLILPKRYWNRVQAFLTLNIRTGDWRRLEKNVPKGQSLLIIIASLLLLAIHKVTFWLHL